MLAISRAHRRDPSRREVLLEVCVAALPMMAILGIGVLIITYVPWLTTGLLTMLGR